MALADPAIVPPKPRITEFRVMRRPRARRAAWASFVSGGLATIVWSPTATIDGLLAVVAVVSGVAALVLWFVEQPRAIVVRKIEREPTNIIVH